MKKITVIFIGMGCLSLPFVTYSHAEMKPGDDPSSSEIGSTEPRGATKAGETDITNTKGQGSLPSKYTIMPVARGKKVEVESKEPRPAGRGFCKPRGNLSPLRYELPFLPALPSGASWQIFVK